MQCRDLAIIMRQYQEKCKTTKKPKNAQKQGIFCALGVITGVKCQSIETNSRCHPYKKRVSGIEVRSFPNLELR